MKTVLKEYGGAAVAAFGGILLLGTIGQLFCAKQGLLVQMIEAWGNGGCG